MCFVATVVLVGFFDTNGLFCGSMDQIDSTAEGNETAFCTITGNNHAALLLCVPRIVKHVATLRTVAATIYI